MRIIIVADDKTIEPVQPQEQAPAALPPAPVAEPVPVQPTVEKPAPAIPPAPEAKEKYKDDIQSLVERYKRYQVKAKQGDLKADRNMGIVFKKIWNYPYGEGTIGTFLTMIAKQSPEYQNDSRGAVEEAKLFLVETIESTKDLSNFTGLLKVRSIGLKKGREYQETRQKSIELGSNALSPYIKGFYNSNDPDAKPIPEDILQSGQSPAIMIWEAFRRGEWNNYKDEQGVDRITKAQTKMQNEIVGVIDSLSPERAQQLFQALKAKGIIGKTVQVISPDGSKEKELIKRALVPMSRAEQFSRVSRLLVEDKFNKAIDQSSPDRLRTLILVLKKHGVQIDYQPSEDGSREKQVLKATVSPRILDAKGLVSSQEKVIEAFLNESGLPVWWLDKKSPDWLNFAMVAPQDKGLGISQVQRFMTELPSKKPQDQLENIADAPVQRPDVQRYRKNVKPMNPIDFLTEQFKKDQKTLDNIASEGDIDPGYAQEMKNRFKSVMPNSKEFGKIIDYIAFGYEENDPRLFIANLFKDQAMSPTKDPKQSNIELGQKIEQLVNGPFQKPLSKKEPGALSAQQRFNFYLEKFVSDLRENLSNDEVWKDMESEFGRVAAIVRRMLRVAVFVFSSRMLKRG